MHGTAPSDSPPLLPRAIGSRDLVLLIINSIIGAGIFGLPSRIYALTGVWSLLAFACCASIVVLFILCFAEVGSRFRETGGPYTYVFHAFGPVPAFLVGWLLLLSRIFNYATLINLLVSYAAVFLPSLATGLPRALLMSLITATLTLVNYLGLKHSTRLNNLLTIAKLVPLALFIAGGLFFLNGDRFDTATAPLPSFDAFSQAVLLLVFAFGGFESVMVNTGEIRNPERTIPKGLLLATGVVALFYIGIQVACIGLLPGLASSEKPLADAAALMIGPAGSRFIAAGALISILGTLNILLFSGSRLPFAFAMEGQFPTYFSQVHPRYRTPSRSLIAVAVATAVVSLAWTFLTALTVAVIIRVLVYGFVCASLIRLRKRFPLQKEFYRLPGGKGIALAGLLLLVWLLSAARPEELRNVALFLGLGLIPLLLRHGLSLRKGKM
jgi:APA family basic amino acid/polyamine antiporter